MTDSNMVAAAKRAEPVLALLLRRPAYLDEADDRELRVIVTTLNTVVGSIDARLEQSAAEPTDMAGGTS